MIFKPLSDFVLEQKRLICEDYVTITEVFFNRIVNYTLFLKQENHIGLYIPCDEKGNVLKEPDEKEQEGTPFEEPFTPSKEYLTYQKAKEKVLFKGFYLEKGKFDTNDQTTYLLHSELDLCVAFKKDWEDRWDFVTDLEEVAKFNAVELTDEAVKRIYGI